jgi:hypothetical protein
MSIHSSKQNIMKKLQYHGLLYGCWNSFVNDKANDGTFCAEACGESVGISTSKVQTLFTAQQFVSGCYFSHTQNNFFITTI